MRTKIVIALCALGLLGLLAVVLTPTPVVVSTARVERGYFAEFVEDEGFTRLRFTRVITAPITGYLRRVTLEPGDRIQPGQVLFVLEPSPPSALDSRTMEQARNNLEAARAKVAAARFDFEQHRHATDYAQKELERQKPLFEQGTISRATLDRYQNDMDRRLAAKQAARALAEAARYDMENAAAVVAVAAGERTPDGPVLSVRAPAEEVVLRRGRHHEGFVPAGEVILETGSFDDLEVQVNLLSFDAVRVRPGMRVILENWGGEGTLDGRVRRIEPAGFTRVSALGVDEQRVPVFVNLEVPLQEREHLGEGYRVEARFILWENDPVVQIPFNALWRARDSWQVFVVENGRAIRRAVQTGRRSGLMIQITAGLEPQEIVVTHPGDRIGNGARVKSLAE